MNPNRLLRAVRSASLVAALLCVGCGSPLLGSYKGTANVVRTPSGGGASITTVVSDVLINIDDVGNDGADPKTNLQLTASGGSAPSLDCLLLGASDGSSASIPKKNNSCTLTQDLSTLTLQGATGTAQRSGDVLTIDVSGDYTGDTQGGAYTLHFNANFVPGTAP